MDTKATAAKTKQTRKRGLKIRSINDLKDIVNFLEPLHVRRFAIDGVEIEFDTAIAAIHKAEASKEPTSSVQQAKDAKGSLEQLLAEESADDILLWSSGK